MFAPFRIGSENWNGNVSPTSLNQKKNTHLLEIEKNEQGENQGDQTEQIAAGVNIRGYLDGGLEFMHIGGNCAGRQNVMALIVVGVIGPCCVRATEARRIV